MSQLVDSAKNTISNATSAIPSREALTNSVSNVAATAQSTVANAKSSINNTLSDFSSKNVMNTSSEFLSSNSIIAKFAFLILLLVVFMVLLKVGGIVINYFMSPTKQPYLVKGFARGNIPATISQDPANSKAPVVYRSNNQSGGIEFTWTAWLLIDSVGIRSNTLSHIFNKGNNEYLATPNTTIPGTEYGIAKVNNGPGLYIGVSNDIPTNSLVFLMDAQTTQARPAPKRIVIPNVPMQKWFHVAYRFQNYNMDCYVNGTLANSVSFGDFVPKQNYDDVYIGQNGGFNGAISNLRYYDYALSPFDIMAIVNYGPNLTPASIGSEATSSMYDYLAVGWYSAF